MRGWPSRSPSWAAPLRSSRRGRGGSCAALRFRARWSSWPRPSSLGLLWAVLDGNGKIVEAARPLRVLGAVPGAAADAVLGSDVAVLRRGTARGAASGRIAIPGHGPAQAVLLRARRRPARDVLMAAKPSK